MAHSMYVVGANAWIRMPKSLRVYVMQLDALEDVARQLDAEVRGAPQGLIDLLPTRTFAKSLLPPELANKDEHTTYVPTRLSISCTLEAYRSIAGAPFVCANMKKASCFGRCRACTASIKVSLARCSGVFAATVCNHGGPCRMH
jgi:hypothetical protein